MSLHADSGLNAFVLFAVILLAGLAGGELARRARYLPRITGLIITGFVLGPSVSNLLDTGLLGAAQVFVDTALGLILFQLGFLLDLKAISRDRTLLVSGIVEALLTFASIFAALALMGLAPLHAALAAALGVSSSPAVILLVSRELNAKGPVTQRAMTLVAINNVLAFLCFTLILPFLHFREGAPLATVFLEPLWQLAGSLGVAWAIAWLTLGLAHFIGYRNDSAQFALLIGIIVLGVGLAQSLAVSQYLTMLALGAFTRSLDRRRAWLGVHFGHGGYLFFVILFVVAGANLHIHELQTVWLAGVAFVLARAAGKTAALLIRAGASGQTIRQASLTSLTLMPMAGLAIGLTQFTSTLYPEFAARLAAIVLAAVAILETLGPPLTEYALKRAGEVEADASADH